MSASAAGETKRIVELALQGQEDAAIQRLTEVVERDECSLQQAAAENMENALHALREQKRQGQSWALLVGSMSGLGWPLYLIWLHQHMGWQEQDLLFTVFTVLVTLAGVAVGAALGWIIGR